MPKIAVVAHTHHPIIAPFAGGMEMHTQMLCELLVDAGHQVTLYAKEGSAVRSYGVAAFVPDTFEFRALPDHSSAWMAQEMLMRTFYQTAMSDIVIGGYDAVINNSLSAVPVERHLDIPILHLLHTPLLPWFTKLDRSAFVGNNKTFATVSRTNARSWSALIPGLQVIYNGIEYDKWDTSDDSLRSDELRWAARITPEKGLTDAIMAAHLSERPLQIAGPISDVDYFDAEIKPLLGGSIQYVGHLGHNDLRQFYASGAASMATPLWEEPFGLSVLESLATGTPVAAYNRGALGEVLNEETGVLAETNTSLGLADAVDIAVKRDANACRNRARTEFSAETMVDRYLSSLRLESARAPSAIAECVA